MLQCDASEDRWMFEIVASSENGGYQTIRYTTCKVVGTGSFGSVFKAIRVDTGTTVRSSNHAWLSICVAGGYKEGFIR